MCLCVYMCACGHVCVHAGGSSLNESVPCCAFESASPRPCFPLTHFLSVFPLLHLKASSSGSDQSPCHYSLQRKLFMGLQR